MLWRSAPSSARTLPTSPGLDRSVFACGVSTVLSGCLGGPSLTIHSENTGVLAVTHLYSPTIVRFGALWMALLAFCPKFNALVRFHSAAFWAA